MKVLVILLLASLVLIPSSLEAFAQVVETQGEDYDLIENYGIGEITGVWQSHPDRIMIDNVWENYALTNNADKVIFNTNAVGSFIFDKASCSYSIYENGWNGANIIPSVSAVASYMENDVWSNLAVNDQACTVEVVQNESDVIITSTKVLVVDGIELEKFVQELNLNLNGFKETFKVWKNDGIQNLGISQTVHTQSEIVIGNTVIPIAEYSGQSFDKQFIIDNRAEILQLTDKIGYEFTTGIKSLTNVNILYDESSTIPYKVNLDYANGLDGVPFVNYLEIDPTFTSGAGDWWRSAIQSPNGNTCGTSAGGNNKAQTSHSNYDPASHPSGNGWCHPLAVAFDISSISTGVTITDVDFYVDSVTSTYSKGCDWYDYGNSDLATDTWDVMLANIVSASKYVDNETNCNSVSTYTLDLGTGADADVQANILTTDKFNIGFTNHNHMKYSGAYFTAKTINAFGTGTSKLIVTYTVPLPEVPTSLSIDTQDVANELTLRWVAPTSGATPDGYKIGRSVDGGTWNDSYVADTGTTAITYDNTGLSPDTSYAYRVWSLDGTTASTSYASVAGTTTWNVPDQVGTVTGTSGTNPALSWSAPSSDGALTNYKIYRGGVLHDTISSSSTTYSDSTSVVSGSTYAYTVSAVSAVGEGSQSVSINVVAGVPPNPATGISASIPNTATAPLVVTVSFSASATVGTGSVTGFQLLRDGVAVTTGGIVSSLSDTAPAGGTEYAYTIVTLGTHGNSVASASSSVTTPNVPSAPTLSVEPKSTSRIDLTWNTPADNNSLISGYKVQISANGGSSYTDVLTGNVNTVYQALSLSGNAQYHFKVSAINGVGTGTASNVANTYTMTTTPATLTATSVSETQINLQWGASTGATGYKIEYESPTDNGFTTLVNNTGNTDLTNSITSLTTATQYNFKVSGWNNGGTSVASPEASTYTWGILSAPTLDTITRVTPTSLRLDFSAGGGLPVATGYKIERQTGSGWIDLVLDTASTDVTFTDTLLSSDESATYRIYAINSIGTSLVSNEKTSDIVASSGGGGGGSSSNAVSSQSGISKLVDLTFIDQIHRVILGEFLSKSINVAWDSTSNIEVKSIIVGDSPFRIVFQEVPFVLIGDPSGISNGKINYSVQIPNDLCTQDGQVNCVEQKQYDIPVEIQTVHDDTTLTKSSVIKINLASGSDIPLIFVLLAIGAVPVAFILRKVGGKKSKRKASGSSHKSSKNGSNTKKVTV